MGPHNAREGVQVGNGDGAESHRARGTNQFLGVAGSVQKCVVARDAQFREGAGARNLSSGGGCPGVVAIAERVGY